MKMPDIIEPSIFAPCGMNCLVCYVHLKKKKPCRGCLGDDADKPERCRACGIKSCARARGIVYCYDCGGFPCKRIKSLDKSYRQRYQVSLIENGGLVMEEGLGSFFEYEMARWTCKECRGVISLHDRECSDCGLKT